jgi:hypothetical protein
MSSHPCGRPSPGDVDGGVAVPRRWALPAIDPTEMTGYFRKLTRLGWMIRAAAASVDS